MNDLGNAWRETLPPSAPVNALLRVRDDLLTRWREPHRHYHTVDHLTAMLRVIAGHAAAASDPAAVSLAAWFHDAVYDPRRVDNEEASALLAEASLPGLDVAPARVAEVARLVRVTAGHDPAPGDRNGGLITDADLVILAAAPDAYRAYTVAIRREYAHVPDAAFAVGRATVLHHLLELPRLFHTAALRELWEDAARHNLTRELDALRDNTLPYASI